MDYQREMWILLAFIAVGAVIYVGLAEFSTILYNEKQEDSMAYWFSTKFMLMGLFISGLSILVFCRKLERLRDDAFKRNHRQPLR